MYAIRGIRLMMDALSKIQTLSGNEDKQEDILDARSDALESSWLCGTVLGWVHMGLHHKICHTLGGQLNTPHAETHAILLPHTLLYNFSSLDKRQQSLFKEAFDVEDGLSVAKRIRNVLIAQQGVPTSLQQLGVQKDELEKVAKAAVAAPYPNPRQLDEKSVLHMLQNAWEGTLSE
ncbi:hypothetical protein L7F22_042202 [Adiantum nelumboides]|nr:hypothetical protein [Adiantum nelumboides]